MSLSTVHGHLKQASDNAHRAESDLRQHNIDTHDFLETLRHLHQAIEELAWEVEELKKRH